MSECSWKPNWEETKQHFRQWWQHEGLVIGQWGGGPRRQPREETGDPGVPESRKEGYTNARWRAASNHYGLARQEFPMDVLPVSGLNIGPGSLALCLGSQPGFAESTVWFEPTMHTYTEPETLPPLRFDPANRWWRVHEATARAAAELGKGKYLVGCPDLVENIDILAALRDPQTLLMDMLDRPEWVEQKVEEINQAWFEVYSRLYEIIALEDGSSAFDAFRIWGPGKTAKVQCDAAAMFSPAMFERFVVPALTRQCEWLDYSMFHLDGSECICQLDLLLSINALDAIEWTPDPNVPGGGDPAWYDMYRRILAAGKSVQALGVTEEQLVPLLDAVGGKGMYIMTELRDEAQVERVARAVEPYR